MMTLIDDYSRKCWVYFLEHKNEALEKFKLWKVLVENQTGKTVKKLRTDRGLEFCSQDFKFFCAGNGIARHLTVPGTPQQNGVAERLNRTLLERARCMLSNAGLWERKFLWAEAISTASFLVNRSPYSFLNIEVPEEKWTGKPVDYSRIRIFGCPAYSHISQDKLAPRAHKCIFLGYDSESKGYRLWPVSNSSKKLLISRDVTFDEKSLLPATKVTIESPLTMKSRDLIESQRSYPE